MARVNVDINDYANSQPPKVKLWIAEIDKLMRDNNCRVVSSVVSNKKRTDGKFTYTSKRTKKSVCIINMGTSGNYISMRGNHFIHSNGEGSILDALSDDMFTVVRGRASCGCRNPDHNINPDYDCVHGVAGLYTYKGETLITCLYGGFDFVLNETTNFDMLAKWIALEAAFDGEIKPLQKPRRSNAQI